MARAITNSMTKPSLIAPTLIVQIVFLSLCIFPIAAQSESSKPSGGWRLQQSSSPYLLMHVSNPVEWHTWNPTTLAKAHKQNKPLFVSIGYFTCHWCHVMEKESFRNPEIAALLNKYFVPIKIDREQRPDLDNMFMRFVQLTTGSGGWPMSVWATPQGQPFFGGTYFPPEAQQGQTGFKQILLTLIEAWRDEQERVLQLSNQATRQLQQLQPATQPAQQLAKTLVDEAILDLKSQYDVDNGGFAYAPKFPRTPVLLLLLERGDTKAKQMALHTLDNMASGGIRDQLAGGFHRYTTDAEWRAPHFEKMLYDQAYITQAYLAAFHLTKHRKYADIARETLLFTLQHMQIQAGGFISALSADSLTANQHLEEGAYYTWSWQQWQAALPDPQQRDWASHHYNVEQNGNVLFDRSGKLLPENVLFLAQPSGQSQRAAEPNATNNAIANQVRQQLLAARALRPAVPRDDKIISAWNAYMISTLVKAGQELQEPGLIASAETSAKFLHTNLYNKKTNLLYRDWRNGVLGGPGFAEDYAALANAYLDLYSATGKKAWLDYADSLTTKLVNTFLDQQQGGFFNTTANTQLWLKDKIIVDNTTPSPNSLAIEVLLKRYQHTNNHQDKILALQTARWLSAIFTNDASAIPHTLRMWPVLMDIQAAQAATNANAPKPPYNQ